MRRQAPITGNRAAGALGRVTQKPKPPEPPRPPKKAPLPPRKPKHRPKDPEEPMPEKTTQPEPTEGYKAFCRLIAAGAGALEAWHMRNEDVEVVADELARDPYVADHTAAICRFQDYRHELAMRETPTTDAENRRLRRLEEDAYGGIYRRMRLGVRIEDLEPEEIKLLRARPWKEVKKAAAKGGNDYAYGPPYDKSNTNRDGLFLAFIKWHPRDIDSYPEEKDELYQLWIDLRRAQKIPDDIADRMRDQTLRWLYDGVLDDEMLAPKDFLLQNIRA